MDLYRVARWRGHDSSGGYSPVSGHDYPVSHPSQCRSYYATIEYVHFERPHRPDDVRKSKSAPLSACSTRSLYNLRYPLISWPKCPPCSFCVLHASRRL